MRIKSLAFTIAIVLAFAVPASAISLGTYQGPVTMKFRGWDTGVLYNVADGVYSGAGTLNGLTQTPPPNSFFGEDSWGVAQLTTIVGSNNQVLWDYAIPNTPQITALFFGEQDTYLNQTTTAGVVSQQIHGVGFKIAFFEDPAVTAPNVSNPPAGGTASRTGEAVFTGMTNGNCIWTLNSTPGFNVLFPTDEFFSTFFPFGSGFGNLNSTGGMYANTGTINLAGGGSLTGTQNDMFTGNPTWRIDFTGQSSSGGFLVLADDPIDTSVIPEPVTMAGLLLGIGGLVRYTRKRR